MKEEDINLIMTHKIFYFELIIINRRKKMIKSGRQLVFTSTLGHLFQNQAVLHGKKPLKIDNLFENPQRELFELNYLYNSSHIHSNSSYRWIIKILQHFNEETKLLQSQISDKKQFNNEHNRLTISFMRFMYREMLGIAVMEERELRENDFATKLKQWYLDLKERHSFLEGVAVTWKKSSKDQEIKLQEMIRLSYTSNVYNEYKLEDYLRKRIIVFQPQKNQQQKQNSLSCKARSLFRQPQEINLPHIDVLMYRREELYMREVREKKIEQEYMDQIAKNKNKMREICRNNRLKYKCTREKSIVTEQKELVESKTRMQPNFADQIKKIRRSSSILFDDQNNTNVSFHVRKHFKFSGGSSHQNSRSKLININGIGLIRSKCE